MERRIVSEVFADPKKVIDVPIGEDPIITISSFDNPEKLIARQTPIGFFQVFLRTQIEEYVRRETVVKQVCFEHGINLSRPETFMFLDSNFANELRNEVDRRLGATPENQTQ